MLNQAKTKILFECWQPCCTGWYGFKRLAHRRITNRVFLAFLIVVGLIVPLAPSSAMAASIQRVSDDFSKVILKLSPQELATCEVDDLILFAFGQDSVVASGQIERINVVNKSAVIVLTQADQRLASKQPVVLLPFFANPMRSSLLHSLAQYQPYRHPGVEAQAGIFVSDLRQHRSNSATRTRSLGRIFAAQTHLPVYPDSFGLGLGYEHRGITNSIAQTGDDATSNFSFDRVEPAFWFQPESNLRLALRYDFTSLTVASGGGIDSVTYDFIFYQPHVAILWFGDDFEFGLAYRDRAAFTASDTDRLRNTGANPQQQRRVLPAEIDMHWRLALASGLVWGAKLGGVFHERVATQNGTRDAKPKLYDMLRLASSLEQRLAQGVKLDYELVASGAMVPNLSTESRRVHSLGLSMAYYKLLNSGLWLGGMGEIEGGRRFDRVVVSDPLTGTAIEQSRRSFGSQFRLQLIARYDLSPKLR